MTEEDIIPEGFKRCECGYCNEIIPAVNKQGKPARFKHGHNSKGKNSSHWNGGRGLASHGYVRIWKPDHPRAWVDGRVYEHDLIMEQMLGRPLTPTEVVHHINGNKQDNRPENLRLFASHSEHEAFEKVEDMSNRRCCDCGKDTVGRRWHTRGLPEGMFRCNKCYIRNKRRT